MAQYKGQFQITAKLLKDIFGVDENAKLVEASVREFAVEEGIVTLVFESEEQVEGQTWLIPEGGHIPNFIPSKMEVE
jgi:hypothetical protein